MKGSTRAFQIASLCLLVVCFAQAAWWVFEETRYTAEVRHREAASYAAAAAAANELLAHGFPAERIEHHFPHVAVEGGTARVRAEALLALDRERRHRLNRYGWEGSFFLVVLLAVMGVIVQALRANNALLRRQQNFLASVSHELKSPLASLRLAAETMLLRPPDAATVERLAGRIVQDSERLGTLISNLLDVARLEASELAIVPSAQPLKALVEGAVRDLGHDLEHVALSLDVPGELEVWADPEAFRACVRNLLSNAAKSVAAKGSGGVSVRARRTSSGGAIELVVADEGLGFEPKEARRLFEKFYRTGDEMRRRTKGSGLGLYLVRHVARMHGARVQAASAGLGRGAEFTLRWPGGAARGGAA